MKIFGFTFGENDNNENLSQEDESKINGWKLRIPSKIETEDNSENETTFFKSIYNSTSNLTTNFGESIVETFNSAKVKSGEAYDNSIILFSDTSSSVTDLTKQNFVIIKDRIGETYEQIEIKNNLYLLLDLISIPILIIGLKKLSLVVPIPQAKIGIIVLIGFLLIFEEHKSNVKGNELTTKEINDKTNLEVSKLLKNVDLRSIISTLQPFEKQIPYSKQLFFIVKLFAK